MKCEDRFGIWSVSFCGGRKSEEPGEKSSVGTRTNNKHNPEIRETSPVHIGEKRALGSVYRLCS